MSAPRASRSGDVLPTPTDAAGFSLIELAVVVVIVGILGGVLLDRLLPLLGRAERAAFLQTQADLQSALLLEAAEQITSGDTGRLAELASGNPMRLFLRPPPNYVGSVRAGDASAVPRASWYFDERDGRLAYRVGREARFDALGGAPDVVEFRVALIYEDRDGDSVFDPTRDRFEGLKLEPTHAYRWPE
ncbi:MAG TPA: prepilin-type N-terminal cleavage/methylation domain-containing protein [Gammaproteobacteria bacterium]|nr:prepilin-type N-terminal cleavage/methylation domain-containing protein [Gammaproteobacteria bacterium]